MSQDKTKMRHWMERAIELYAAGYDQAEASEIAEKEAWASVRAVRITGEEMSYQEHVLKTEAPVTPELMDRLTKLSTIEFGLFNTLWQIYFQGGNANALKKFIFYGKHDAIDKHREKWTTQMVLRRPTRLEITNALATLCEDVKYARIVHAILGKIDEVGELCGHLFEVLFEDKELDPVNVMEESGDGLWYDGILLDAVGFDFPTTMQRNIAKLQKRYEGGFSEKAAAEENRDRAGERKALEGRPTTYAELEAQGDHTTQLQRLADDGGPNYPIIDGEIE